MGALTLTLAQAREVYKVTTDLGFKKTLEENYPELIQDYIPIDWNELEVVTGYYVSTPSYIEFLSSVRTVADNRNICKTRYQAEVVLAYCQLTQLMGNYYEQTKWNPDWKETGLKYCIELYMGEFEVISHQYYVRYLAFKTEEHAKAFLNKNRVLVETYLKG